MSATPHPAAVAARPQPGPDPDRAAGSAGQAGSNPCLPGAYLDLHAACHRAPNAGIWRLMWWLCGGDNRAVRVERAGVSKQLLDRMVAGNVVPDPAVAIAIAQATDGQVLPEDFELATYRGPVRPHWSEMPAPRGRGGQDDDQRNPDQEQDHDR